MLEAWKHHAGTSERERAAAPPLLPFRSITVSRDGRSVVKGHVEFCGVAIIERLEHVIQRDPTTGRSFPNLVLDLAVLSLAACGDILDMRWIDDRRDPNITVAGTARHPPRAGGDGSPRDEPPSPVSGDGSFRPG